MGTTQFLLCVAAVLIVAGIETSSAYQQCPPPSKIYSYSKRESCKTDKDCRGGMVCCPNPARVMSCTVPDSQGGRSDTPYSGVVTCEGVKCQPYEVCKPDPRNKSRKKCQRP